MSEASIVEPLIKQRTSSIKLQEFSIEVDVAIKGLSSDINLKNNLRNQCLSIISQEFNKMNKTSRNRHKVRDLGILKAIKRKVKDNNVIISLADKGNCLVVMDCQSYQEKVEEW